MILIEYGIKAIPRGPVPVGAIAQFAGESYLQIFEAMKGAGFIPCDGRRTVDMPPILRDALEAVGFDKIPDLNGTACRVDPMELLQKAFVAGELRPWCR